MKINECGRSMIEMLGVLSIVGILSVGGIAGFSKAMAKYKFDRSLTTYAMFIQDVMKYQKDWNRAYYSVNENAGGQYNLRSLIIQTGLKPDSWKTSGSLYLIDESNAMHFIDARGNNNIEFQYNFGDRQIINNSERNRRCVIIISEIIKPLNNLKYITFWRGNVKFGDTILGRHYCQENAICLDNLTLGEIYDQCTACSRNDSSCGIVYTLN